MVLHTPVYFRLCPVPQVCHGHLLPLSFDTHSPSCLGHTPFSRLLAKLTPIHISSLSLHIPSLQKLSMSPQRAKASQTSLYFPFNEVDDNNYDCDNYQNSLNAYRSPGTYWLTLSSSISCEEGTWLFTFYRWGNQVSKILIILIRFTSLHDGQIFHPVWPQSSCS